MGIAILCNNWRKFLQAKNLVKTIWMKLSTEFQTRIQKGIAKKNEWNFKYTDLEVRLLINFIVINRLKIGEFQTAGVSFSAWFLQLVEICYGNHNCNSCKASEALIIKVLSIRSNKDIFNFFEQVVLIKFHIVFLKKICTSP